MSWLDFFHTTQSTCKINFGRGINADISLQEEELFFQAFEAFEKKDILNAYEYFLSSLINYTDATSNENITFEKSKEALKFTLYQGCAIIKGTVTPKMLYAEATIVKHAISSVALKRYILERNYQLTYTNYFSDETYIKLKLYQDNIVLSPQKVFFPLRELALNADFDKEHIRSEFKNINVEETEHLEKLKEEELQVKYKYLHKWIDELETKVLTLPSNDNAGMQSFLYLNILFKIDYLLTPKYKMYQKLSKKVQEYFSNENATIEAKNEELKKYLLTLKEISYEEFTLNFYKAKYSFNPIEKSPFDDVINFINESQNKIKWYKQNRYVQIISTIYNYIAFNSLYNFGMNPLLTELFHTLVEIQNSNYFRALGCTPLYDKEKEVFAKRAIISRIKTLVQANEDKYKSLVIFTDDLNFASMNEFCYSYCVMLKNLDFEEI